MDIKECIVKSSIAPLYLDSSFKSELVSQALIWENLTILDKKSNWYKVRQWDSYISWIHNSYISDLSFKDNYKIKWYYLNKTISKKNLVLSFGSALPVIGNNSTNYHQVLLPDLRKVNINKKYLIDCNNNLKNKDIIKYAIDLIGVPYLWGGKSSFGYDCSGFIQSIIRLKGIVFPRDCIDQINSRLVEVNNNKPTIGDLIYFKENNRVNHVGMYIDEDVFIHSSGQVKINSINKKNKHYSDKLSKLDYDIYRFNENNI